MAASAAPICRAKTSNAYRGARGSHLIKKYANIGNCAAMSSCQTWALDPSSASRTTPKVRMWRSTTARAMSDMAIGRKALGFLLSASSEPGTWFVGYSERSRASLLSNESSTTYFVMQSEVPWRNKMQPQVLGNQPRRIRAWRFLPMLSRAVPAASRSEPLIRAWTLRTS
jgi:hypothetical protein